MKKYLFTSAAALAFCGLFTSCTHDLGYDESSAQNSVVKTYEQAFVTAFGQPDPNQEWGFGSNSSTRAFTRAVGTYADYRGSLEPTFPSWSSFTFPTDCDASKFLAAVPSGVDKFPADGNANGGTYYIDNTTSGVNLHSNPGIIYVSGEVDFSSKKFEIKEGSEIYLPVGSSLKLAATSSNQLKATIYIANRATLETAGTLKMDNSGKVYNHGTIKAASFEVNSYCFLYNVGSMELTGRAYLANEKTSVVNDGTITCSDVAIEGSANVQNNAEWTVNGTTTVNSNNASWVNNGHWTTEYYKYTAGSENVINNCFLEVNEDFDINLGDGGGTRGFKIDAGGGVLTKNFNGGKNNNNVSGPYRVIMGSKAVFKVTGTAALAAGSEGTWNGGPTYGYGFFGVGNDYAVFQATHIVKAGNETDKKVQYGGNLYVSAEDHFASEYNEWNKNITFTLGFTKANIFTTNPEDEYSTGKPDITIEETPCNPGFGDNPGPDPDAIRVICEDLSVTQASDWDFNDAVFDVQLLDENKKVKITLLAAGGTLPLTVAGEEVHGKFQEFNPNLGISTGTMLSTGSTNSTGKYHYINCEIPYYIIDNIFGSTEIKEVAKAIPVQVQKLVNGEKTWVNIEWKKGAPTAKMAVGTDYNWCDERTDIRDNFRATNRGNEYPTFNMYVQGILEDDWYTKNTVNDGQAEAYIE